MKQTRPITTLASDDRDTSAVSEEENVHKFARKSYGEVASPYLSPYVHKSGFLDAEYGLRKVRDKFFICNSDVTVDASSNGPGMGNFGVRVAVEVLKRCRVDVGD